jgi:hypothetical protein
VDVSGGLAEWVPHEFGVSSVGESAMPENGRANEIVLSNVGVDRYVVFW